MARVPSGADTSARACARGGPATPTVRHMRGEDPPLFRESTAEPSAPRLPTWLDAHVARCRSAAPPKSASAVCCVG
eukprot:CAMPEP_0176328736 /NCGR_PEP_ID=MMETSP0121_2-20121125/75112_1 /TAXON_ID=160619 /ORGANISM="Kryptoperidinium foliaceum, Strain CCMP 1326" /LENGTH=75 /DNA_ID=CAMNT_0017671407 /DNA_START=34 /DNA_END=261 /DNA_ORIENTATION=-